MLTRTFVSDSDWKIFCWSPWFCSLHQLQREIYMFKKAKWNEQTMTIKNFRAIVVLIQNPNQDLQNTVSPPFSPSDSSPPPLSPSQVPATQQLPSAATQVNNQYITSSNAPAYNNNHSNHFDGSSSQHSKPVQKPAERWASFEDDDQGNLFPPDALASLSWTLSTPLQFRTEILWPVEPFFVLKHFAELVCCCHLLFSLSFALVIFRVFSSCWEQTSLWKFCSIVE